MIFISAGVMSVTLFSLAQSTQPCRAALRKIRGTRTSIWQASLENLTLSSIRLAAYITDCDIGFFARRNRVFDRPAETFIPEIEGIAVTIIDRDFREVLGFDPIDDRVLVFLFHQDLIDLEDEVAAEFARDAIEIMVRPFDPFELADFRFVFVSFFELIVPAAFEDLIGLLHHEGAGFRRSACPFSRTKGQRFILSLLSSPGKPSLTVSAKSCFLSSRKLRAQCPRPE
jgi:hypothetical protein